MKNPANAGRRQGSDRDSLAASDRICATSPQPHQVVMSKLLAANPDLGPYGYWSPQRLIWGNSREQFELDRESASTQQIHLDGFAWANEFLTYYCKSSRNSVGSYYLKHVAEDAAEKIFGQRIYVANGILILAALSVGIRVEWDREGPNARLAVRVTARGGL